MDRRDFVWRAMLIAAAALGPGRSDAGAAIDQADRWRSSNSARRRPNAASAPAGFSTIDRASRPVRMLIGSSGFAGRGFFGRDGYRWNDFSAFKEAIKTDGFSSFVFIGNTGTAAEPAAGKVFWGTKVGGWSTAAVGGEITTPTLDKVATDGLTPCMEMVVAGVANEQIAAEHPGWRMLDRSGKPLTYMGPLLDWDSPYWNRCVLPLYHEYAAKYGSRTAGIILWEPQIPPISSPWLKRAFQKSGAQDIDRFWRQNQTRKWRELAGALKSAGWRGRLIGGGWAAFEWEEQMWDGTIAEREKTWNEIGPFKKGIVPIMMPELLIDGNYGPHAYRRADLHYVYRSLMYERSVFGDHIMPNVELYWPPTAMTPDELFRWILESYSAGFPSYSVVDGENLYFDRVLASSRQNLRAAFRRLNPLGYFGRPVVNFRFLVSADMERRLMDTPSRPQGRTLWDWYVKDSSRLFKSIDRAVCGGALVNARLTSLSDAELYGLTEHSVTVAVVPEGLAAPHSPDGRPVYPFSVARGADMASLKDRILSLIRPHLSFRVGAKSELAYVNRTRRADGREFLTVLNHSPQRGEVEIGALWPQAHVIVDSSVVGIPASYRRRGSTLHFALGGHGAIVLSNRPGAA